MLAVPSVSGMADGFGQAANLSEVHSSMLIRTCPDMVCQLRRDLRVDFSDLPWPWSPGLIRTYSRRVAGLVCPARLGLNEVVKLAAACPQKPGTRLVRFACRIDKRRTIMPEAWS